MIAQRNVFDSVHIGPGIAGGAEVRGRLLEGLGGRERVRRCVTLYEQEFFPRFYKGSPERGGIPSPANIAAAESMLARLIVSKGISTTDLVLLDVEMAEEEHDVACAVKRLLWRNHLRSGAWSAFNLMYRTGYERSSYNSAQMELVRRCLRVFQDRQIPVCFYDVNPNRGYAESQDPLVRALAEQRARWAALNPIDTQSIYPRYAAWGPWEPWRSMETALSDVPGWAKQNLKLPAGQAYRHLTLIQCPVYTNVPEDHPAWGRPLHRLDIEATLREARDRGAGLIWWGAFNDHSPAAREASQLMLDGLLRSDFFDDLRRGRERVEGEKGVEEG